MGSELVKRTGAVLSKNAPAILTGVAVIGTATTAIFAAKAAPKASWIIGEYESTLEPGETADIWEKVKISWHCYIPAAVAGLSTVACIIGAQQVNSHRNAALLSAYSIAQTAAKEYSDKVVEVIGEKKNEEIRDEVNKDRLKRSPVDDNEIVITNGGKDLCYDSLSGRYFLSDMEALRRAQNDVNQQLLGDSWISLNELYSYMGLRGTKLGETLGWIPDNMIEMRFTSMLAENGEPCLVVEYETEPKADYWRSI